MATQSLSDAANSGILDVIVESTATKIFLPTSTPGMRTRRRSIAAWASTSGKSKSWPLPVPKRQYYYVSENGRRLYDLALGPMALAFVGASDKESVATIKSLASQVRPRVGASVAGRP